jgi:single-stranded-DNA-specific exonuclease
LRRWRVRPSEQGQAARLAAEGRLRPLTARILAARGLHDPERVARFLAPRLDQLRPATGLADLEIAVERLARAVRGGERVGIFGDCDVDGVTTAALLASALRALGADVEVRVAGRASAHGFTVAEAGRLLERGCRLVVTGDCGTSDHQAIAHCRERGGDVIVIDHHTVPQGGSPALALINPHRPDDRFPFKGLASCGLAFHLATALHDRLRAGEAPAFDRRDLLDLVALGTVADLVPLVEENRILVAEGLRMLGCRPGLRALARVAELGDRPAGTAEIALALAPRLNAAGRLGEAQAALDLLLATDEEKAQALAAELDDLNRRRQRLQEDVWEDALRAAEDQSHLPAVVVGGEGWHPGVVSIVAARLVERFRRPAVVVGFSEGQGRGSARTIGGFDLHDALSACREHLVTFGGHRQAAGMSLVRDQLGAFRAAFVRVAAGHFAGHEDDTIEVDAEADLAELDLPGVEELARLAPFGAGNAEPLLAVPGVVARASRVVGERHLLLGLARSPGGPALIDGIGFGMAGRDPGQGSALHLIATAEVDSHGGGRRSRLRLRHLLRGGP